MGAVKIITSLMALIVGVFVGVTQTERESAAYLAFSNMRDVFSYRIGLDPYVQRDTENRTKIAVTPNDDQLIFMTYGQSNAASYGETGYKAGADVLNHYDGHSYSYEDPALGASGIGGSVWGRVGDLLIENSQAKQVVFGLAAIGAKSIGSLSDGLYYERFLDRYNDLKSTYGRVDGILFHQGEGNHYWHDNEDYEARFIAFLDKMKNDDISSPVFLSIATYCNSPIDEKLQAIQKSLIKSKEQIYAGPNTDLLVNDQYRAFDRCHFSNAGFDAFAKSWADVLKDELL